jgi:hypothetical protein
MRHPFCRAERNVLEREPTADQEVIVRTASDGWAIDADEGSTAAFAAERGEFTETGSRWIANAKWPLSPLVCDATAALLDALL